MTPGQFVYKWQASELKERSGAQEHFIDLCRLLDEPTPAEADPTGESYCFERGVRKDTGGSGWADVWKRGCFGWEYKGKHANLDAAFNQLRNYALALENPPLLIVSDMKQIRIRTNWTNSVSKTYDFTLDDLLDDKKRRKLKWAMSSPERLRPGQTRQAVTELAAATFAELAQSLREQGHDSQAVARFVNRFVFCMFAEDAGLLPSGMFTRMINLAFNRPETSVDLARDLFGAMSTGGRLGLEPVEWFNGGLFDDDTALPLTRQDIWLAREAAKLDWSEIDPSILGTLFERGLDPEKRSQLGAHYTDRDKIMRIIEPVIVRPLLAEWKVVKAGITDLIERASEEGSNGQESELWGEAEKALNAFLDRLRRFAVLDPACGSGNFLYLALHALKDIEHRVQIEAEAIGLPRGFPGVGPANVRGIEINAFAAELARVSVWIGEIQWMRRNGFKCWTDPILKPLDTVECRDAILGPDGTVPDWPEADVVIGNPPFLGGKLLIRGLGEDYVTRLFVLWRGRVPLEADLVCFWFVKAGDLVAEGKAKRVGLVATNSIRGGANRRALQEATDGCTIYDAWSDEPWVVDGAAVRVSLVCFSGEGDEFRPENHLNGDAVDEIYTDLTAKSGGTGTDLTRANRIQSNSGVAFMGDTKGGKFEIPGDLARKWLRLPANPNGQANADVLRPWVNGIDLTRRPAGKWIVDFGWTMSEADAALFESPFGHIRENVLPRRRLNRRAAYRHYWWRHVEPRQGMWRALEGLTRYISTPAVSKHRLFVWLEASICPDHALIVIARDDDTIFGILHSRFHEVWSLRLGTWLGKGNDPRYTPTTTFQTFPFPKGLTPDVPATTYAADPDAMAIADAARKLVRLRDRWLNPPEWVEWVDEPVPGYPKRPIPRDDAPKGQLKARTLTNLYNDRPQWLVNAHQELDTAVAKAYGWDPAISDDEALGKLLELNLAQTT